MNTNLPKNEPSALALSLFEALSGKLGKIDDLRVFDCLDSTNTYLKRAAVTDRTAPKRKIAVIALSQTAGRGRMGRSFFSPSGCGLYMSIFVPSAELPDGFGGEGENSFPITARAGIAAAVTARALGVTEASVKWVNDIVCPGGKLCGILAEGVSLDGETVGAVVGMGINLRRAPKLPMELEGIVTSLDEQSGGEFARIASERFGDGETALLAAAAAELTARFDDALSLGDGDASECYRALCSTVGRTVEYYRIADTDAVLRGRAVAVEDGGALVIEDENGKLTAVKSGEVRLAAR